MENNGRVFWIFLLGLVFTFALKSIVMSGELYVVGHHEKILYLYDLESNFIDSYEFPIKLQSEFISTNDNIISCVGENKQVFTIEWIIYEGDYPGFRYFIYKFPEAEKVFYAMGPTNYIDYIKGDSEFEDFEYNFSFQLKKILSQEMKMDPILLYFGSGEAMHKKVNKEYGNVIKQGCGGDLAMPSCPWISTILYIRGEGLRCRIESRLSSDFDKYDLVDYGIIRDIFLENGKVFFLFFGIDYEKNKESNIISYDIKSEKVKNIIVPTQIAVHLDQKKNNEIFFKNNVLVVREKSKLLYYFFKTEIIGDKFIKPLSENSNLKIMDISKNRQLVILSDNSIYDMKRNKRINFSNKKGKLLKFFYYNRGN